MNQPNLGNQNILRRVTRGQNPVFSNLGVEEKSRSRPMLYHNDFFVWTDETQPAVQRRPDYTKDRCVLIPTQPIGVKRFWMSRSFAALRG